MKLEPILNRVVLKQVEKEKVGSFTIAPDGQKSADQAEVIAVGPGLLDLEKNVHVPCRLQPGDVVLINAYFGVRATVDGEELIIQKEEEILAKVTE